VFYVMAVHKAKQVCVSYSISVSHVLNIMVFTQMIARIDSTCV